MRAVDHLAAAAAASPSSTTCSGPATSTSCAAKTRWCGRCGPASPWSGRSTRSTTTRTTPSCAAFLDWLDAPASLRELPRAWNGVTAAALPCADAPAWAGCVQQARQRLLPQDDLVTQLLRFVRHGRCTIMRLLLVEDDDMIGRAMRQGLGDAGFAVDWVTDGQAAELALANGVYDLAGARPRLAGQGRHGAAARLAPAARRHPGAGRDGTRRGGRPHRRAERRRRRLRAQAFRPGRAGGARARAAAPPRRQRRTAARMRRARAGPGTPRGAPAPTSWSTSRRTSSRCWKR